MSATDDEGRELRSRGDLNRERKATEKRLSALATTLTGLSAKQLGKLDLDERIVDAVDEARRMTSNAARIRQLRIVRRELRGSDSHAIALAVDALLNPIGVSPTATATAKSEAQGWAERFVDEGPKALERFLAVHTHADRQHLRGLVRNVHRAEAKKVAKAHRALVSAIDALMKE